MNNDEATDVELDGLDTVEHQALSSTPKEMQKTSLDSRNSATVGNGVDVALSLLADAGCGLFAQRSFERISLITEYAGQKLVDKFIAAECFPQTHMLHMSQMYNGQIGNDIYIDGIRKPIEGLGGGSFANHMSDKRFCNAKFVLVEGGVFLEAKRFIDMGEEIYVHCGTDLDIMMGRKRRRVSTNIDGRHCIITEQAPPPPIFSSTVRAATPQEAFVTYKSQARIQLDHAGNSVKALHLKLDAATIKNKELVALQNAIKETLQDKNSELQRLETSSKNIEANLSRSREGNYNMLRRIDAQKMQIEDLQAELKEHRGVEGKEEHDVAPEPSTPIHEAEMNKRNDEESEEEGSAKRDTTPIHPSELNKTEDLELFETVAYPPNRNTISVLPRKRRGEEFYCRCATAVRIKCAQKGCRRGHCGAPSCAGFSNKDAMKKHNDWMCNMHSKTVEVRCAWRKPNGNICDKILDDRRHRFVTNSIRCSCASCIANETALGSKSWSCWSCAGYKYGVVESVYFPGCKKI